MQGEKCTVYSLTVQVCERLLRFRRTVSLSSRPLSSLRPVSDGGLGPDRLLEAHSPLAVDLDGVVTLRTSEDGIGSRPPLSCYSTIRSAVERWPGNLAWVNQDKSWTYEQYFQQVTIKQILSQGDGANLFTRYPPQQEP